MRDNGPITRREVFMKDGTVIVSSTDTKGKIRFVNDDFIDISGFTKEELIGQPHNLVRHPDMPPSAFADLWRDLKSGKPWNGFVKNRTKSGDHYWVEANAMPVTENGEITGYISIRRKPDAATVKAVSDIYDKINSGAADDLSIVHGRAISSSRKARLDRWLHRFSSKIVIMGSALCVLIAIVSGVGIYFKHKTTESLRTVYEDRTIPAGQLAEIDDLLYTTILNIGVIANAHAKPEPFVTEAEEAVTKEEKIWSEYMATYLTPEEEVLAKTYAEQKKKYIESGLKPILKLAKSGDIAGVNEAFFNAHELHDEANETNKKLVQLQLDVAKDEYEHAKKDTVYGLVASLATTLLAVAVAVFTIRRINKALSARLIYVDDTLKSISGGKYDNTIAVGDDELQSSLTMVMALQAKLAYSELEKQQFEREKKLNQNKMADDFERSVKGIVNVVASAATELSQTADSMVKTTKDSAHQASNANDAAASTTANVQSVAAASEELSSTVKEISTQLQKTTQLVLQSQEKAKNADKVANKLNEATNKVASAMEMISRIASQINLLSLNATIESARAGDAGKGFAVVASEVKNLANMTDKTTSDIQQVVDEMREAAQAIIQALGEIGHSVVSISEATSSVASAVEEQSATTSEISKNMQTAATSTQSIAENLQVVQASSNHAGSASEQMLAASKDLSTQAEELNMQVENFLKRVRAG